MLLNVITGAVTAIVKASASSTATASTSTKSTSTKSTSASSSSSWESNMANLVKAGPAAIQARITEVKGIVDSGKGTAATTRYLNQITALKDGAKLTDVIAGKYDSYSPDKSGVYSPSGTYGPVDDYRTGYQYSNGVPVSTVAKKDVWTKRDELSFDTATMDRDGAFIPSKYTQNVGAALAQGGQTVQDVWNQSTSDGFANTAVMVLAGAAALVAVSKLFGK